MVIHFYLIFCFKLYFSTLFQRVLNLNSNFSHYVYYINSLVAKN